MPDARSHKNPKCFYSSSIAALKTNQSSVSLPGNESQAICNISSFGSGKEEKNDSPCLTFKAQSLKYDLYS